MRILLILLFLPVQLFSQEPEGVWTGTIFNDTTRKFIPYEIVITESKGKLSGFSHTVFAGENNKQETGVKSLKIKKKSGSILIEDDELIFNNYDAPPPKGVRQYSVLNFVPADSGLMLIGVFNTNRTKEYASLTGSIRLKKKEKYDETKIITKLEELNLAQSLSFVQVKEKENLVAVNRVEKFVAPVQPLASKNDVAVNTVAVTKEKDKNLIDINEDVIEVDEVNKETKKKQEEKNKQEIVKKEVQLPPQPKIEITIAATKPEKNTESIVPKERPVTIIANLGESASIPEKKESILVKKVEPVVTKEKTSIITTAKVTAQPLVTAQPGKQNLPEQIKTKETAATPKEKPVQPPVSTGIKPVQKSAATVAPIISAEEISKRKIETIRTVEFKTDSLVLTLYDNGVVDGDTVSVILNGKVIMSKQGLTTNAINKTIYTTAEYGDSLQLILYAENLGSIPPNTGLLIIQDGADRYQIRFAGDLQKNAAINLRRSKSLVKIQ